MRAAEGVGEGGVAGRLEVARAVAGLGEGERAPLTAGCCLAAGYAPLLAPRLALTSASGDAQSSRSLCSMPPLLERTWKEAKGLGARLGKRGE